MILGRILVRKYDSVKLPVCQSIPGQLKSPPSIGELYREIFALFDKHNELNHPKLTQKTGVDNKMNKELCYSVYGCARGSAPRQLHRVNQS